MVRAETGDVATGARLSGTADTMREQANLPRPPPDTAHLNRSLAKVRGTVSEEVWNTYVREGRASNSDDAIAAGVDHPARGSIRTTGSG
jgi:hypothetical protein